MDALDHAGPGPEKPEHPDKPDHFVTIYLDNQPHRVRPGVWLVRALKAKLGVDQALVLAEITREGVKDLDDDGRIRVHDGQKFMAHPRSGGAS